MPWLGLGMVSTLRKALENRQKYDFVAFECDIKSRLYWVYIKYLWNTVTPIYLHIGYVNFYIKIEVELSQQPFNGLHGPEYQHLVLFRKLVRLCIIGQELHP